MTARRPLPNRLARLALLGIVALTGCAENAIFELDLVPPSDATGVLNVMVLSTDETFEDSASFDLGVEAVQFPLDAADPPHVTVVADSEDAAHAAVEGAEDVSAVAWGNPAPFPRFFHRRSLADTVEVR